MTLLTVDEMREHVESDLSDTALQLLVDAAERRIIRYAGPHDVNRRISKSVDARRSTTILLPYRAESVTSVTIDEEALDTDDYDLEYGGLSVRIWFSRPYNWTSEQYARYTWLIEVNYVAEDDIDDRKVAQVQLVRMDTQHDGLASERTGQYSRESANYGRERRRILATLRPAHARIA